MARRLILKVLSGSCVWPCLSRWQLIGRRWEGGEVSAVSSLLLFIMDAEARFSREEINSTVWEVPEKYTRLKQIGTGAYGSVW